jgi:HEAT repeat protein
VHLLLAFLILAADDVDALVAALNGRPTARDKARAGLLEKNDPKTAEAIEKAVASFAPANQAVALTLLRDLPEEQGRATLRRLLADTSTHLRLCAALALYGTNEPGLIKVMAEVLDSPELSALDRRALSHRLLEFNALEKGGVGEALLRPERTEDFLVEFFASPDVRKTPAAVAAATVIAENDKRAAPRAMAAAYLVRHKQADYAAVLGKALAGDGVSPTRFMLIQGILLSGPKPPEIAANVMAKAATKQKSGKLVALMLRYLRFVAYPRMRPLCEKLIEHASDDAATQAFAILAALKSRPPADALKRIVENGPDAAALEAARLLVLIDDDSGFDRVLRCAKQNPKVRASAIKILGMYRRPPAVETLIAGLEDADGMVRLAAEDALIDTLRAVFPYRRFNFRQLGYSAMGKPEERAAAVAKIRAWWEKNKDADW